MFVSLSSAGSVVVSGISEVVFGISRWLLATIEDRPVCVVPVSYSKYLLSGWYRT